MKLLLAALLAALAIFLWEFVAHMFTPLGEAGLSYMPKPSAVSSSMESAIGDKAGMYMFPTGGLTAKSSREEQHKAMERVMEEMKTKPSGMLIYKPAGTQFNFGKTLAVQFVTDLVKALLLIALLSQTVLASFGQRVGFVVLAGILGAIVTNIPYWNWYGFTGSYTASQIVMEIIGFFCAGLVIAWLYKPAGAAV
ncbi:MAG: hypothetical protein ACJ8IQ_09820 [Chthoniobacterales bacterium]|jgi:hypothetical protein